MRRIQRTPCSYLFKSLELFQRGNTKIQFIRLELFQRGNTKIQFIHINIPTLYVTHKYVIKLPESRSCPVRILLSDAIIQSFLKTVPFFLNLMKFYQLNPTLRLSISPWFP